MINTRQKAKKEKKVKPGWARAPMDG